MAVGSVQNPKMSFEEWLKAENKTGEVKKPPARQGQLTDNGVPVDLAQQLHSGKSIFQVSSQNPTKETAAAGGASSVGSPNQSSGMVDGGQNTVNDISPTNNSPTVLAAGATGHSAQSQAPVLASGLQASQGNENTGANGGPTSQQLNQDLYAQYERAMAEAKIADEGGEVSTGEGTLSTGGTDGAGGTEGADGVGGADGTTGADGASGVNGDTSTPTTNPSDPTDTGNTGDNTGNNENPNDTSNDNSADINRQEERRQEEVLDTRRFHKFREDEAA